MSGVGWLVRTQLRRGWRSYVGLALLIGLAGGLVIAGFAGARRNATAFDRMVRATNGWDVLVNPDRGNDSSLTMEQIRALPQVAVAGRVDGVLVIPADITDIGQAMSSAPSLAGDGTSFYRVGGALVREGAMPDPSDPNALVIDHRTADRLDLHAGDPYPMRILSEDEAFGPAGPGADLTKMGEVVPTRVAAVTVSEDSVATTEGSYGESLILTPALFKAHPGASAGYWGAVVKLRSPSDVDAFRAALTKDRPADDRIVFQTLDAVRNDVAATVDPQTTVLLVFSGVALLLAVLVVGQAIWRRLQADGTDAERLSGVGVTHRQRFAAAMARVAATAVVGSVLAVLLAVALSPLTPIGDARAAEPDLGVEFNIAILAVGGLLVVVVGIACALLPAWRTTSTRSIEPSRRPSWSVARVSSGGAPPPVVAGVRFALDPGRGKTSVPVRTTLLGAVSGVLIIAATLTFASSLRHFTTTPSDYGGVATATFESNSDTPDPGRTMASFDAEPAIRSWVLASIGEFSLGGERVQFVQPLAGKLQPARIIDGHAPGPGEVVMGRRTLEATGTSIGDTVEVTTEGGPQRLRVVGSAVFPLLSSYPGSDKGGLGTGAWIAPGAGTANADQGGGGSGVGPQQVWLSLAPGTDQKALAARLTKTTGQDQVVIQDVPRASIVRALGDLDRTPLYLAFLICFLVGATVIHALTAAVWRRRRDIALLQTLGFTRGQVRRSVLVQATVIGLVALVVGLPLGIIVGRWAWSILSDTLGTVAGLTVPWAALALVVAVVLVLVNAVGLIPATRVLHRTPAQTLRSE
jgi:hypothetical protein